jgi:hypothetical protein
MHIELVWDLNVWFVVTLMLMAFITGLLVGNRPFK